MPSHMSGRARNVVSWSSCIGTQLPQAVGMALAARRRGKRDIGLAFLGDGATSHPDFHAALNFAGVFGAPSYVLPSGEIFWGQDRLELLDRALKTLS